MKNFLKQQGFTLIEVLLAAALILSSVLALLGVHSFYLRTALGQTATLQAVSLAEEGLEVVRFWRNLSWTNRIVPIPFDTGYGLSLNGGDWSTTTDRFVENFERRVTLSAVYRDASGDIVTTGGTLDPNTLLVSSQVSWSKGWATTTKSVATYLTNLYDN